MVTMQSHKKLQPILREEVEISVTTLKRGKSAEPDNIPTKPFQAGKQTITVSLLTIIETCKKRTGE